MGEYYTVDVPGLLSAAFVTEIRTRRTQVWVIPHFYEMQEKRKRIRKMMMMRMMMMMRRRRRRRSSRMTTMT